MVFILDFTIQITLEDLCHLTRDVHIFRKMSFWTKLFSKETQEMDFSLRLELMISTWGQTLYCLRRNITGLDCSLNLMSTGLNWGECLQQHDLLVKYLYPTGSQLTEKPGQLAHAYQPPQNLTILRLLRPPWMGECMGSFPLGQLMMRTQLHYNVSLSTALCWL